MPGSRSSFVGSIAGASLAVALASALAGFAGCSSDSSGALIGGDDGADASFVRPDGAASDATVPPLADGAFAGADAGGFTGLVCAVTPCAVGLAAGGSHVCALLDNRTVRCWGQNASGELGMGSLDAGRVVPSQTPHPTPVDGLTGVGQITAGGYATDLGTSCAMGTDGGVACWGSNANGGLGLGRPLDGGPSPALSIAPLPLDVASPRGVALGGFFGCTLTADGGVACWGDNSESELGRSLEAGSFNPTPGITPLPGAATAVAAGKYHACALLLNQSVVCWGAADHRRIGQLADGGVAAAHPIAGLAATEITAGEVSTCAITTAGGVACWGGNQGGQLGRGATDASDVDPVPQPVALPSSRTAVQIASAVSSACVLLSDHTVWCWGDNAYGELGTGAAVPGFSPRPAPVQGLSNVVQIASGAGGWTVCALLQDGSVRCWGANNADQLGVDTSGDSGPDESPHPLPVRVMF